MTYVTRSSRFSHIFDFPEKTSEYIISSKNLKTDADSVAPQVACEHRRHRFSFHAAENIVSFGVVKQKPEIHLNRLLSRNTYI